MNRESVFVNIVQLLPKKFRQKKQYRDVKEFSFVDTFIFKVSIREVVKVLWPAFIYFFRKFFRDLFTYFAKTEIVATSEGFLRGRKCTSVMGQPYYSYQGIRYGRILKRFQEAEPSESWTGVKDALKEGNKSIQLDLLTGFIIGSEDCLFLNIYTPKLGDAYLPVMVWLHPGAFVYGWSDSLIFGPDYFLKENVVLVTLNYRLGALGFLGTGTKHAPGNMALKDVVLALRWVQKNISVFGGNPDNVTLFGESSGSCMADALRMTPKTKGLFHRLICQSGTICFPWAVDPDPLDTARRTARILGCNSDDPAVIVNFLEHISAKKLIKAQFKAAPFEDRMKAMPIAYKVCVEEDCPGALLTMKLPYVVNDVPIIVGNNNNEGHIQLSAIYSMPGLMELVDKHFDALLPSSLNLKYGSSESEAAAKRVRDFYFDGKPLNAKNCSQLVEFSTDGNFVLGTYQTTCHQMRYCKAPIFRYQFIFDGSLGVLKRFLIKACDIAGPAHGDEIGYLFHIPLLGHSLDPDIPEMKVTKKMVRLWCNFAKHSHPTPHLDPELDNIMWEPANQDEKLHLEIGEELRGLTGYIPEQKLKFWRELGWQSRTEL